MWWELEGREAVYRQDKPASGNESPYWNQRGLLLQVKSFVDMALAFILNSRELRSESASGKWSPHG
jgi:hypothetical protein